MDSSSAAARTFDKLADLYREKFMDLNLYEDWYREFCALLPRGPARVLDAACGPGNVSRRLMAHRPDLEILGIDLAPRMVELAREAVPSARFAVQDCRHLASLERRFHGIICAFGLPYLSPQEMAAFIRAASQALDPPGILCLSTLLGGPGDSGCWETCSTGDRIFVHYHGEERILDELRECGFTIHSLARLPSPAAAAKATTDLVVLARR